MFLRSASSSHLVARVSSPPPALPARFRRVEITEQWRAASARLDCTTMKPVGKKAIAPSEDVDMADPSKDEPKKDDATSTPKRKSASPLSFDTVAAAGDVPKPKPLEELKIQAAAAAVVLAQQTSLAGATTSDDDHDAEIDMDYLAEDGVEPDVSQQEVGVEPEAQSPEQYAEPPRFRRREFSGSGRLRSVSGGTGTGAAPADRRVPVSV